MEAAPIPKHKIPRILRILKARPRLVFSIIFAFLIYMLVPEQFIHRTITRSIVAWAAGASLYLGLAFRMMFSSSQQKIRSRARLEDEGQFIILLLVILAVFAALSSVVFELGLVRNLQGPFRYYHLALVGLSILIAWFFTHTMFALHYAHDFYLEIYKGRNGGLEFPGSEEPEYGDFLYLSFVVGTSAQTADISYTTKRMRRLGLLHAILSFFFNTTLLALAINIGSGLI
jgi:uncharacterized membrane protein